MMPEELESWLVLIVHPQAPMLLAARDDAGRSTLPQVRIPMCTRLAQEATAAIAETWGVAAVALFRQQRTGSAEQMLVLTIPDPPASGVGDLEWMPFGDFSESDLVERALRQLSRYEEDAPQSLFCQRRWIHELEDWVSDRMSAFGLHLTGKFTQFNCGPSFALIRFETNEFAVWFKATGEPNRHEFDVTRELNFRAPEFIPQVIAFHGEWNGWLMREAEGRSIEICDSLAPWAKAAESLAVLQTRFCSEPGLLQRVGCPDRSLSWVGSKIKTFFEQAERWMERQPVGTKSRPLSPAELRRLEGRVHELIIDAKDLAMPETLVHGDVNAGNLITSSEGCVLLDWAEAWISHPFVSFEYLKELLRRTHPTRADWLQDLRSAYAEPWRTLYGNSVVDRALAISPALAALVYALACADTPCHSERLRTHREQFLRSLVRRIGREISVCQEAAA